MLRLDRILYPVAFLSLSFPALLAAHEPTRPMSLRALLLAQNSGGPETEAVNRDDPEGTTELRVKLIDTWSNEEVPGLVRLFNQETGRVIELDREIERAVGWYAIDAGTTLVLPRTRIRIEALRGLTTLRAERSLDLRQPGAPVVELPLRQFYETRQRGLVSGNTHLHLMDLTHAEADRYLRVVPRADDLDLVFLSHLRRLPDERKYISNIIVENSFTGGDLHRLSQTGTLFGNGQEHRHNFTAYGEGYGHVMLLNLQKLIRPISIGPGIMRSGTDGRPLQTNIRAAHDDGATVIWCHNTFGLEDLPNWVAGACHALNIFDGGDHGTYADSFYRYLNLGMRVPFSTGTDWFIYDFARVYVPIDGERTPSKWLQSLRAGKSFITNGPLLELETERAPIGGTLELVAPNRVTVVARGMGRLDFAGLELVYNGEVVHRVATRPTEGYFTANLRHGLEIDEPGWFALRVPLDAGDSELGKPLFAHTSPIYVRVAGKELFRKPVAEQLIAEMRAAQQTIRQKGVFANSTERQRVLAVYDAGIAELRERLARPADEARSARE